MLRIDYLKKREKIKIFLDVKLFSRTVYKDAFDIRMTSDSASLTSPSRSPRTDIFSEETLEKEIKKIRIG